MTSSILGVMVKKVAKTVAVTALEGVSYAADKLAEYSDEGQEWVENLDKKDTTAREERKEKRNNKNNEDVID